MAATVTPTTLSAAIADTQATLLTVASATGFAKNQILVCDSEAMWVDTSYVSGTTIPVVRGMFGTKPSAHASSAAVYCVPASYVSAAAPAEGTPVTGADQLALPLIVINSDGIGVWDALGGSSTTQAWQHISQNGTATDGVPQGSPANAPVVYTGAGAITPQPGAVGINGTTLAMTIVDPTRAQDGMRMVIYSVNASAHTLTYTAGFGGGTTARDVATFGGAVNDCIIIWANAGTWWVESTRNVTLG